MVLVQLAPPPERPSPVISPFWMVNGMTRSNGLSPATSSPFIPIGRSVACRSEVRGQEGLSPPRGLLRVQVFASFNLPWPSNSGVSYR